jgi:hypothetical protein
VIAYLPHLLIALALSLAGNVFLGWQWAQAGAECETEKAQAVSKALKAEQDRAAKDERVARDIATDANAETTRAVTVVLQGAMSRERDFLQTPVTGACVMPATPSLQPSIDAANAAGRDALP